MYKVLLIGFALILNACAPPLPKIPIETRSVDAGTQVMRGNDTFPLLGTALKVGDPLPSVQLFSRSLKAVNLADLKGQVLLISIVPSLDTQVCERQTRTLAELGPALPTAVRRVTISRDLPFAQNRFAEEVPPQGEMFYLSDFAEAEFGRSTGLLIDDIFLLARAAIVADKEGIVRYMQVVPSITYLPDLAKAAEFAAQLAR